MSAEERDRAMHAARYAAPPSAGGRSSKRTLLWGCLAVFVMLAVVSLATCGGFAFWVTRSAEVTRPSMNITGSEWAYLQVHVSADDTGMRRIVETALDEMNATNMNEMPFPIPMRQADARAMPLPVKIEISQEAEDAGFSGVVSMSKQYRYYRLMIWILMRMGGLNEAVRDELEGGSILTVPAADDSTFSFGMTENRLIFSQSRERALELAELDAAASEQGSTGVYLPVQPVMNETVDAWGFSYVDEGGLGPLLGALVRRAEDDEDADGSVTEDRSGEPGALDVDLGVLATVNQVAASVDFIDNEARWKFLARFASDVSDAPAAAAALDSALRQVVESWGLPFETESDPEWLDRQTVLLSGRWTGVEEAIRDGFEEFRQRSARTGDEMEDGGDHSPAESLPE